MGIARVIALAMTVSCLSAGCGTTSLFGRTRPITLSSVLLVARCEGLVGAEAERELRDMLSHEIRKRGLLCEDAESAELGVWLTVAERIRFSSDGGLYRYDCDVLIASARGGGGPEKILERNFTVDTRRREYFAVREAIVNRLADLMEEAAEKI